VVGEKAGPHRMRSPFVIRFFIDAVDYLFLAS
jgi:hypothetical protein